MKIIYFKGKKQKSSKTNFIDKEKIVDLNFKKGFFDKGKKNGNFSTNRNFQNKNIKQKINLINKIFKKEKYIKNDEVKNKPRERQEETNKKFFENIMLIIFCCIYAIITIFSFIYIDNKSSKEIVASPKKYTICLDAGHGGRDGGAVGSFTKESDINLAITQKLTKLFVAGGFNVVNTRTEDICLSDENSPSFKLDDMKKRREIISSSNPNIVISIHCNKFSLPSCVGAQVFYQKGDDKSKELAETMMSYFIDNLFNARKITIAGDYYVLQSANCPSVLVECGYVSNPDEEKLLSSDDYQQKLAYSIYSGTIKFFMTSFFL